MLNFTQFKSSIFTYLLGPLFFICWLSFSGCQITSFSLSHERLQLLSIDPLSDHETLRMKINLRYLQHTLEQLMLFILGQSMIVLHPCMYAVWQRYRRASRCNHAARAVWLYRNLSLSMRLDRRPYEMGECLQTVIAYRISIGILPLWTLNFQDWSRKHNSRGCSNGSNL